MKTVPRGPTLALRHNARDNHSNPAVPLELRWKGRGSPVRHHRDHGAPCPGRPPTSNNRLPPDGHAGPKHGSTTPTPLRGPLKGQGPPRDSAPSAPRLSGVLPYQYGRPPNRHISTPPNRRGPATSWVRRRRTGVRGGGTPPPSRLHTRGHPPRITTSPRRAPPRHVPAHGTPAGT